VDGERHLGPEEHREEGVEGEDEALEGREFRSRHEALLEVKRLGTGLRRDRSRAAR
jgi:hypothetical protein